MKREITIYMEKFATYLASKSIGRSIPWYMYKVQKPEGLEKMLEEMSKEHFKDK